MRTTVELPPELMRQAKARAAAQGESLKSLLTRAVSAELGKSGNVRTPAAHVRLPLFGNSSKKPVNITSDDVRRALAEDSVAVRRRPRRSRKK